MYKAKLKTAADEHCAVQWLMLQIQLKASDARQKKQADMRFLVCSGGFWLSVIFCLLTSALEEMHRKLKNVKFSVKCTDVWSMTLISDWHACACNRTCLWCRVLRRTTSCCWWCCVCSPAGRWSSCPSCWSSATAAVEESDATPGEHSSFIQSVETSLHAWASISTVCVHKLWTNQ